MLDRRGLTGTAEHQPVAVRARPDLIYQRQIYQGQGYWLVKDPVSLRYHRLGEEAYTALRLFDGRVSLHHVKTEIERRYPLLKIKYDELQSLLKLRDLPDKKHIHTLAGLVLDRLSHVPVAGEYFEFDRYRFEVVDMDGLRIDKVMINNLPATQIPPRRQL